MKGLIYLIILLLFIGGCKVADKNNEAFNYYSQGQSNRMAAEWEPASGVMIAWPLSIPYKLVVDLSKDLTVYTLVENEESKGYALKWYATWGIDTSKSKFIYAHQGEDAWWVRDWGPHAVFTPSGKIMLGDGRYLYSTPISGIYCNDSLLFLYKTKDNKIRLTEEEDNATKQISKTLGIENLILPFVSTGGNVMVDGQGTAFSTCILNNENRFTGVTDERFFELNKQLLGINHYNIIPNFETRDIQHIDCYMKLLDEERILVLNPPTDHPDHARYEEIEKNVLSKLKTCYNRPYEILKIDSYRYDKDNLAAYTNAIILNKTVYVPLFSIPGDSLALKKWAEVMPGYTIKGYSFNLAEEPFLVSRMKQQYHTIGWFKSDALHCRTRAIWDKEMLYITVKRPHAKDEKKVYATIIDYSTKGLVKSSIKFYWRIKGTKDWKNEVMKEDNTETNFFTDLPSVKEGETIEYYISATSNSGHNETMPCTAPEGFYSFSTL